MAKNVWAVLCRKSVIDNDTKLMTLIEVLEKLEVSVGVPIDFDRDEVPAIPFDFEIVCLWVRSEPNTPEKSRCRLRLTTPDGKQQAGYSELAIDLEANKRFRTRFRSDALPLSPVNGLYQFDVELAGGKEGEWILVASLPFEVTLERPSAEEQKTPPPKKRKKS